MKGEVENIVDIRNRVKLLKYEKKQLSDNQITFIKSIKELLNVQHNGDINAYITSLYFFAQNALFPENEILLRKFITSIIKNE